MNRKLVLLMTLMVFLVGMLSVAFKVKIVEASETITIRADGSISPPTPKITSLDNITYTFTDNITDSIVVERSNIIIDGNGHTVQGSGGGKGFYWYGINNVTVKDTNIKDFAYGVSVWWSNNSAVSGNTITNNTDYGVDLFCSNSNTVSGNTITNSTTGVSLRLSNNSAVSGNTITNSTTGVYLGLSNNSAVYGNTITNSANNGIDLRGSNSSVVFGNTITKSTYYGVYILSSNNSAVSRNNITKSTEWGVYLWSSNNSAVSGNTITKSTYYGVSLGSSSNITVSGNTITSNYDGIYLFSSSNNNNISGNTITNSTGYGIWLDGESSNNRIYHNNFIDNPQHAYVNPNSLDNVWDDGYPSGGNCWSNYGGVDVNMDGIGDNSYEIDSMNIDHYPLMGRFSDFPATLEEEIYHVTTVCNSTISAFEFDQVNRIIRFNVTGEAGIGFCRVCIPHDLMEPPYTVTVDGYAPQYVNYTLYDNGTHTWIYFTYQHSTHEVEIIPEFPTWTSMLLALIVLAIATAIYKRRLLKTPIH